MARESLPSLLKSALTALERAYVEAGADGRYCPSLELWANAVRAISGEGVDARALPELLRVSKRVARRYVATAVRRGWAEEAGAVRERRVRLTVAGQAATKRWNAVEQEAERSWIALEGAVRASDLRFALERVVAQLPLEHPHFPASYGAADASVTGGHGVDWIAVPRGSSGASEKLALSALLSQVSMAFALAYQEKSGVALSHGASLARATAEDGTAARDLGRAASVSALVRHGYLAMSTAADRPTQRDRSLGKASSLQLTAKGRRISVAYATDVAAIEAAWRTTYGACVPNLRRALEEKLT